MTTHDSRSPIIACKPGKKAASESTLALSRTPVSMCTRRYCKKQSGPIACVSGAASFVENEHELQGVRTQKPSLERECFITAAYASAQMR